MHDSHLIRLNSYCSSIDTTSGAQALLFASEAVPIDRAAITELLALLELEQTVHQLAKAAPDLFAQDPELAAVALTPDFHKGKGIPIGTVLATRGFLIPQAIGNDINCGMRVHTTSLDVEQVRGRLDPLETAFRHAFFEGGRNIPMSRAQREALFTRGLPGLLAATPPTLNQGLWSLFHGVDIAAECSRISCGGGLPAATTSCFSSFCGTDDRLSRDAQIGSIGGGNHFVEIQAVKNIINGTIAHAWGLRPGMVTVMIHTGSVAIGRASGHLLTDLLKKVYPEKMAYPANGIFPLPVGPRTRKEVGLFWDAQANAANFAFANRLFLALMTLDVLQQQFGEVASSLLYDAPHNLVWRETLAGEEVFVHRKGACPAHGFEAMAQTPFAYTGEPVLVPGSMGASSYLLAGLGNA